MLSLEQELFSQKYQVRTLTEADISDILRLYRTNPLYFLHCPPEPDEEHVVMDMRDLPPGKSAEDKRFVGYFDGEKLAAVLDIVGGYPGERIAFIGLFMVDAAYQGRGVGSGIIGELCEYLKSTGYAAVRLCRVETNPQSERFWRKNGFSDTGTRIDTGRYTVAVEQRRLLPTPEVRRGNESDMGAWMRLVCAVAPDFSGLETPEALAAHRETVLRSMSRGEALCVSDGNELAGALLYSRRQSEIRFLAVSPHRRREGVASALLTAALADMDPDKPVTAYAFPEGDSAGARRLYAKFGFEPGEVTGEFGRPNHFFTQERGK